MDFEDLENVCAMYATSRHAAPSMTHRDRPPAPYVRVMERMMHVAAMAVRRVVEDCVALHVSESAVRLTPTKLCGCVSV